MINIWTVILLTFFMQDLTPTKADPSLFVTITDFPNDKGVVRVLLFKNADGFPDQPEKAFQSASVEIINQRALATFENLPKGNYALSVFHDSENTGELRTNIFGAPKDAYGFSNNVVGTLGPPSFEKAAIQVDKDVELSINLR